MHTSPSTTTTVMVRWCRSACVVVIVQAAVNRRTLSSKTRRRCPTGIAKSWIASSSGWVLAVLTRLTRLMLLLLLVLLVSRI